MATPRDLPAACLLALFTGTAGLIAQLAWQRYLGRLVGGDALATAVTLAVFLGGLSVGFLLFGWLTVRARRTLLVYGITEAAIGAWALAFPALFALVESLAAGVQPVSPTGRVAHGLAVAVPLLGPPTIAMGATVPMLTRALAPSATGAGRVHALVYGSNAVGAAAGALATGFVLLDGLGPPGSLRLAGALHLIAGTWFILRGRSMAASAEGVERHGPTRTVATARRRRALYGVAFVGGVAFMTFETATIRVVGLTLGASVTTLALVVAAFIAAVACGAFVVARLRPGPTTLLRALTVATVTLVGLFPLLDDLPWAAHRLRILIPSTDAGYWVFHGLAFAGVAALVLVPAGALGAALPLAFDEVRGPVRYVGRISGGLFACNAAGNLLGGIGGGFALLSALGLGEIWLVAAGLVALTTALAAVGHPRSRRVALAPAVLVAVVAAWFPSHDPLRFAVGTFRLREPLEYSRLGPAGFYAGFFSGRSVLSYRDGPDATVAVVENPPTEEALARRFPDLAASLLARDPELRPGPRPRTIAIDGKADSSAWFDRTTLRLLAHLPALLAERPGRVLVVGLGTGVTAGEFTLHPEVRHLDVAEISPEVVEALPLFDEWTHRVHRDPRLRILRVDAFRLVHTADETWDVIASQPSNPWMGGNAVLFSREFVAAARDRLADDGLFVQWIQRYDTTEEAAAIALNTVGDVFPHVRVFRAEGDDLVVAGLRPIDGASIERAAARLSAGDEVSRSLAELGIHGIDELLALEDRGAVARASRHRDLGLERLDRPSLRARSARAFFRGDVLPDTAPVADD